jgi:hypothetical protein
MIRSIHKHIQFRDLGLQRITLLIAALTTFFASSSTIAIGADGKPLADRIHRMIDLRKFAP